MSLNAKKVVKPSGFMFSFTKLSVRNLPLAKAIANNMSSFIINAHRAERDMMLKISITPYILRSTFDPPVIEYANAKCQIVVTSVSNAPPPVEPDCVPDITDKFKGPLNIFSKKKRGEFKEFFDTASIE
jgi:hypothetical protein